MKWCQKCNAEFEEYVEKCSDCGEALISEAIYNAHRSSAHKSQNYKPDGLNLVAVYESTLESDVLHVSALLEENGIISEIKNEGIGSYLQIYSGVNYLGTSICVKAEDAEAAKMLIENLWDDTFGDEPFDKERFGEEPFGEVAFNEATANEAPFSSSYEEDDADMAEYRHQYNKLTNLRRNIFKAILFLMFGTPIVIIIISYFN